jgi:hypothetical protein
MKKNEGRRLVQKRETQLEHVDWSVQSYKYEVTSDEDNTEEPMSRWILKKNQKRLSMKEPDQQIIRDLVINTEEHAPDKQLEGDKYSMELFIKEAFENIKELVISDFINYSGISYSNSS